MPPIKCHLRNARVELPGDFAEQARYIAAKRAPHLEVKRIVAGAPEHDISLRQYGSRAHADGKFTEIQVQWAGAVQNRRCMRAAHFEPELPMTDIDQGMRHVAEGVLDRFGGYEFRFRDVRFRPVCAA